MPDNATERDPRDPKPDEIADVVGFMPLIAAFFAKVRAETPDEHSHSFADHGLTNRHAAVCVQLVAADGLNVTELANRMGLALSTVSELVGDLDRAEWVERQPDPANRRRTLVSLRPERREHMESVVTRRAEPLLKALDELTPRQREGFAAGLRAWARQLEAW